MTSRGQAIAAVGVAVLLVFLGGAMLWMGLTAGRADSGGVSLEIRQDGVFRPAKAEDLIVRAAALPTPAAATRPAVTSLPQPWAAGDIGACGRDGLTSHDNGVFTVVASGQGIWDKVDSFHFVYCPLKGDGQITARIKSQQRIDDWSRAGVMIREALGAQSAWVFTLLTPSKGVSFHWRPKTNDFSAGVNGGPGKAPCWVRLVRQGNTFTSYRSSDGVAWSPVRQPQTIQMGQEVFVGLAVCSGVQSKLGTVVFDNVKVVQASDGAPK